MEGKEWQGMRVLLAMGSGCGLSLVQGCAVCCVHAHAVTWPSLETKAVPSVLGPVGSLARRQALVLVAKPCYGAQHAMLSLSLPPPCNAASRRSTTSRGLCCTARPMPNALRTNTPRRSSPSLSQAFVFVARRCGLLKPPPQPAPPPAPAPAQVPPPGSPNSGLPPLSRALIRGASGRAAPPPAPLSGVPVAGPPGRGGPGPGHR